MFLFRKRRRNGRRDEVRADIGDLAEAGTDVPEGPAEEPADTGQPRLMDDGIPEDIPAEDRDLMRESRQARESARERNRRDDQTRQTVFACACVVAGFCGVAGVLFGTVAVCRELATGPGDAMASSTAVSAPYVQGVDPSDMNIYYDQSGRMHVNVYVSRQPDVDVNIRIDSEGNVTSETVPRDEAGGPGTETGDGQQPQEGGEAGGQEGTGGLPGQPGDGTGPAGGDEGAGDGGDGTGDGSQAGAEDGDGTGGSQPPAGTEPSDRSEADLLREFDDRRNNGGSGYLDSDGTYVVQRGDTLTKISNATGFSVDFLAAYNQLGNKNLIITGEVLRYPSK